MHYTRPFIISLCAVFKARAEFNSNEAVPRNLASCPFDGILDDSETACCLSSCGECGGFGCDLREGGVAGCCTSQFTDSCSSNTLPCILDDDTSSSDETDNSVCSDGTLSIPFTIGLYREAQFCCPKSCESCGIGWFCDLSPQCCANTYLRGLKLEYSDVDISCRSNSPPCLLPPSDDPCSTGDTCQNGAICGARWTITGTWDMGGSYSFEMLCKCDESGNYTGEFCELLCGEEETPCGSVTYNSFGSLKSNDVCCSAEEICVPYGGKYYNEFVCKSIDRPLSCDPNPCLNGGLCQPYNPLNSATPYFECYCIDSSYSGTYCENEDGGLIP
mmetsp:Transcript_14664/g.21838  ORF Transcript_14664/g.21838 Transcript_14664/m.21838 type:complete len:331 (-) Transcript_14664:39-1031(-)